MLAQLLMEFALIGTGHPTIFVFMNRRATNLFCTLLRFSLCGIKPPVVGMTWTASQQHSCKCYPHWGWRYGDVAAQQPCFRHRGDSMPSRFDRGRLSQFQPETGAARPRNRPVSSGAEPDKQGVLP